MKKTVILAVFCTLAAMSVNYMDKQLYPLVLREEVRLVLPLPVAEILSMDQRGFLADLLFTQVSLHSGGLMWKPLNFQFDSEWAYGMMQLITDLDPKFYNAYLFAGMGLIHNFDDVYRARPILEKGMAVFPDSWELPFWIGYAHYVYWEDYEVAGDFLWQALHKPGAPQNFLSLMISALQKGGNYQRAFLAMKILYDSTSDNNLKAIYGNRMIQLDNLLALQKAGSDYKTKTGRAITDLNDLVQGGFLEKIPEDPFGLQYVWNREKNMVAIQRKINHHQ